MSLEVTDLAVVRADRPVFRGLSFALAPGDVLKIEGRNGVGKTTLLRCLAGLIPPVAGDIRWQGQSLQSDTGDYHRALAFVGHELALKPGQTVLDNLLPWARLHRAGRPREAVLAALQRFAVEALFDVPARYLSSGQKRRVALARLLLVPRTLWLLDEPSVGLDAAATSKLELVIQEHRSQGGIVVTSSHTRLTLIKARSLNLDDHFAATARASLLSKDSADHTAAPAPAGTAAA